MLLKRLLTFNLSSHVSILYNSPKYRREIHYRTTYVDSSVSYFCFFGILGPFQSDSSELVFISLFSSLYIIPQAR